MRSLEGAMLVSNSMWAEKSFTSSSTKPPCSQYSKAAIVELEDSLRLAVREPLKTSMLPYNEQFLQTSVKCGLCSVLAMSSRRRIAHIHIRSMKSQSCIWRQDRLTDVG